MHTHKKAHFHPEFYKKNIFFTIIKSSIYNNMVIESVQENIDDLDVNIGTNL